MPTVPPKTSQRSTPIHVMHIANTANGAPWMHQQLVELRSRGYRVTAAISGEDGTLAARLRRDAIPYRVVDLDIFSKGRIRAAGRAFFALVRLLREERPDVVQFHLYPAILVGRMAAWVADVPVRFTMIPGPYYLEAPIFGDMDLATAPFDSKVIASCEYTRTLYERGGISRNHVELIYYGQDASLFSPRDADPTKVRRELGIAPNRPVVGDVAYFYPPLTDGPFTPPHLVGRGIKGHEFLLQAASKVRRQVPDVLFLLVGEGWGDAGRDYMRQLQALAQELGVEDVVRFTGVRNDIPDTLLAFDVSVQCSLNENLGGSIESLLMARPLVVSDVGGLPDAVLHERTGLLVPPGDADALAAAILRLLQDRPLASRLAGQGRAWALERLTLTRTVEELDALYHRELDALSTQDRTARRGYRWPRMLGRAAYAAPWIWRHLIQRVRHAVHAFNVSRTAPASPTLTPSAQSPAPAALPPARIVHIAACRDNAEWFAQIVSRLNRAPQTATAVITLPKGPLATRLEKCGVIHASMPLAFAEEQGRLRVLRFLARSAMNVVRLAREFQRQETQVVHTHIFGSILVGRVAAWLARVPCRVSMVPGPLHLDAPITRTLDRLTCWMDHRVVAGSRATYERYRALGLDVPRLQWIPYGVDPRSFDPGRADAPRVRHEFGLAADVPVVGLVAQFYAPRTDWQTPPYLRGRGLKGHEDFLASARLVRQQFPTARFLIVGDGTTAAGREYRHALMRQVAASDLADAVIFTGHRSDIPDLLAAMQVAVQCSLSENYGGTIESLMMGRPTVATRVGGMPETVRHEETGLLVPPGDPEALAAAIVRHLANPDEAARMGRAGRALMHAEFNIDRTVAEIEALYASVLGHGRSVTHPVRRATA